MTQKRVTPFLSVKLTEKAADTLRARAREASVAEGRHVTLSEMVIRLAGVGSGASAAEPARSA